MADQRACRSSSAPIAMARERDPFRIPRTGAEAVPIAAFAAIDLQAGRPPLSGRMFVAESSLGGVVVYAVYQALLTSLRTEALVRRGALGRHEQMGLILSTVGSAVRQGAAVSLVLGLLLLLAPWLALPLSLLGIVGMGKASMDLFHAFWDGLSPGQRVQLHEAAHEAGVRLGGLVRGRPDQLLS